jgi:tetratricopeptide (TPR) repeat protein
MMHSVTDAVVAKTVGPILGRCRVEESGADAVVSIERDGDGFRFRVLFESPSESPALVLQIRKAIAGVPASTEDIGALAALEAALKGAGLSVSPMPPGDARGNVHFDPNTGQTVTHFSPVEGGVEVPEGLQRRLAQVAVNVVRGALRGSIGGLRAALAGGDVQAFINQTPQDLAVDDVATFEALVIEATAKPGWAHMAKAICLVAVDTASKSDRRDVARRLVEHAATLSTSDADVELQLQVLRAIWYSEDGNLASARLTLERGLERWPNASGVARAWAFHNLGGIAFSSGDAQAAARALDHAAELRALAGWVLEPSRTLAMAAHRLEQLNAFAALAEYDRAIAALPAEASGPLAPTIAQLRGELEFARGRLLLEEAGRPEQALVAFRAAADLLKPILESADTFASVLIWQEHCYTRLGQRDDATRIAGERAAFASIAGDLRSARIDAALAGAPTTNATEDEHFIVSFTKACDLTKTDLPRALQLVEQLVTAEGAKRQPDSGLQAMLLSLGAQALWEAGQRDDAISWQRRAAHMQPGSTAVRVTLAAFLLSSGHYQSCYTEACSFASDFAVLPHGHFYAGLSAHRTGAYPEAIARLEVAKKLGARSVDALIEDAKMHLAQEPGAVTIAAVAAQRIAAASPPVTHMQFLEMLRHTARRIENNSDVFWKKRKDREFKQSPEGIGKALLAQDLSRDPACRIYNEVQLPGGRIDVTVNVYGTEYILELKMCGGGYSKAYAEDGFDQLETYMKARAVSRAYLLVFDGRVTQSGSAAIPAEHELADGRRVFCVSCNVLGVDAK